MEATGAQIVSTSAQFGPFVFVCVLVILLMAFGLWLYARHVIIPSTNARNENTAKMADAVVGLCTGVTAVKAAVDLNTAAVVTLTGTAEEVQEHTVALRRAKQAELEILKKLADKADVDIDAELGLMAGVLDIEPPRWLHGRPVKDDPVDKRRDRR